MADLFSTVSELYSTLTSLGKMEGDSFLLKDPAKLTDSVIDQLVYTSVFSEDPELKETTRSLIHALAHDLGIHSTSILPLYQAIGRGEVTGFTVPAFNIRALTYDSARVVFRLAKKHAIGAFVIEIARSEMGYSFQNPSEFASSVLAAAIKENYQGAVFLQGDHYQVKEAIYTNEPEKEISALKDLIDQSISSELFNIDIDASTVVNLKEESVAKQQELNSKVTAELTNYIRSKQPETQEISIGGEIGHIGDRNSTPEDFTTFMDQYLSLIQGQGISKVSAQTGSSHGGMVDEQGNLKEVAIDFSVIESIGQIAREQYHMGGAVQHGASTLSLDLYPTFVEKRTLEIHLSTAFQSIIFDTMPEPLREKMKTWVNENCSSERKPEWNDVQFFYKLRKKAIGPFKKELWNLTDEEKQPIRAALEKEYETIFEKLNVFNTKETVEKYIKP